MRRIPPVTPALSLAPWTGPSLPPPSAAPRDGARYESFRVVHHKHMLPGPRVLLPASYKGCTGDTQATTRKLGPLSLACSKAGLAVSPPVTQLFFGAGLGFIWGFGLRQNIHSAVLQTRALRALRVQDRALKDTPAPPQERDAILASNKVMRRELQTRRAVGSLVASAATTGLGVGWLLKIVSATRHAPALSHLVAAPILHVCFPLLGLSYASLATYEAIGCGKTFIDAHRAKRAPWPNVLGHEPQVKRLLRARHLERRWCHLGNAATYALVATGVPLTFFIGPVGLGVLLPGIVGSLAVDMADQRIVHFPKLLSAQQQLDLGSDAAVGEEVVCAQARYRMLHRLRRERHQPYPRGLGVSMMRPFAKTAQVVRRWLHPKRVINPVATQETLARMASEQHAIVRQHLHNTWRLHALGHRTTDDLPALHHLLTATHPQAWQQGHAQQLAALYALLSTNHMCEPFAKRVLEDKAFRQRFAKLDNTRIMRLRPRRWRLDVRALLTRSGAAQDPDLANRLLARGEEVLLVQGKNAAMYRRRQLLDILDARIAQQARRKGRLDLRLDGIPLGPGR